MEKCKRNVWKWKGPAPSRPLSAESSERLTLKTFEQYVGWPVYSTVLYTPLHQCIYLLLCTTVIYLNTLAKLYIIGTVAAQSSLFQEKQDHSSCWHQVLHLIKYERRQDLCPEDLSQAETLAAQSQYSTRCSGGWNTSVTYMWQATRYASQNWRITFSW